MRAPVEFEAVDRGRAPAGWSGTERVCGLPIQKAAFDNIEMHLKGDNLTRAWGSNRGWNFRFLKPVRLEPGHRYCFAADVLVGDQRKVEVFVFDEAETWHWRVANYFGQSVEGSGWRRVEVETSGCVGEGPSRFRLDRAKSTSAFGVANAEVCRIE